MARLEKELTTKKLSEKLGISESYYSMIENGIRQQTLDFSLVVKLADALGLSLQMIAQLEDSENKPEKGGADDDRSGKKISAGNR